jgi:CRISPR-associated protein Cst1
MDILPAKGKDRYFPNFIATNKTDEKNAKKFVGKLTKLVDGEKNCSLCGTNKFYIELENETDDFKRFLEIRSHFNNMHEKLLGGFGLNSNIFWNNSPSFYICPLCIYLNLHHYIPFISTREGQIFINASSFKVMWYLNKFAEEIFSRDKNYDTRKILGLSLMEFSQRIQSSIGAWSMMNIEIVLIKRDNTIDYYSIPYNVSKILLNSQISSLISAINETYVFELVLQARYKDLIDLNHSIIRCLFASDFKKSLESNQFLNKKIYNKSKENFEKILKLLPELYTKINSVLKEE